MIFVRNPDYFEDLTRRLSRSKFRCSFDLKPGERMWLEKNGMEKARSHAWDFIEKRLAMADPPNDGQQTPRKGHPVFIAQHATGCCCRKCLQKWHHIPKGRPLTEFEKQYIIEVLMFWLEQRMSDPSFDSAPDSLDHSQREELL